MLVLFLKHACLRFPKQNMCINQIISYIILKFPTDSSKLVVSFGVSAKNKGWGVTLMKKCPEMNSILYTLFWSTILLETQISHYKLEEPFYWTICHQNQFHEHLLRYWFQSYTSILWCHCDITYPPTLEILHYHLLS